MKTIATVLVGPLKEKSMKPSIAEIFVNGTPKGYVVSGCDTLREAAHFLLTGGRVCLFPHMVDELARVGGEATMLPDNGGSYRFDLTASELERMGMLDAIERNTAQIKAQREKAANV